VLIHGRGKRAAVIGNGNPGNDGNARGENAHG
jgi:hypothetical protein